MGWELEGPTGWRLRDVAYYRRSLKFGGGVAAADLDVEINLEILFDLR
jgi:hypothetical protein